MLRTATASTPSPRSAAPPHTAGRTEDPQTAIAWAIGDSVLGPVAIAASLRGLCLLHFSADFDALRSRLGHAFPDAILIPARSGAPLEAWLDALCAGLDGRGPWPELPLDLRGTAFQMRVWRFLQDIPAGTTRSYAEVAAGIGAPAAMRAVGAACAANRVAVLVPCHRVLRGDGALGGYRWGLERKRALLAAEARAAG